MATQATEAVLVFVDRVEIEAWQVNFWDSSGEMPELSSGQRLKRFDATFHTSHGLLTGQAVELLNEKERLLYPGMMLGISYYPDHPGSPMFACHWRSNGAPKPYPRPRTHHDAFLADIIEHPDDDAPRLIYADWLEEQGEEARGEFIRVQCELAKRPPKINLHFVADYSLEDRYEPRFFEAEGQLTDPPKREWVGCEASATFSTAAKSEPNCTITSVQIVAVDPGQCWARVRLFAPGHDPVTLRRRERELLASHGLLWVEQMLGQPRGLSWGPDTLYHSFRRGFVESITLSWQSFAQHADALLAAAPVREVTLTTWPELRADTSDERQWYLHLSGGKARQPSYPYDPSALAVEGSNAESRSAIRALLAAEWPGITFHLPDSPTV